MIIIQLRSGDTRNRMEYLTSLVKRPRSVMQAAARGARKELQQHFRARDRQPNSLGGDRTHFWLDVYKSVQIGEVTPAEATVIIGDRRFALKVYGGRIRAKNTKFLAIPVDPAAHGVRPALFPEPLIFIRQGKTGLLANRVAGSKSLQVRYLLVRSVYQDPDPAAMPARGRLESAAIDAAEAQVVTEIRAAQPG